MSSLLLLLALVAPALGGLAAAVLRRRADVAIRPAQAGLAVGLAAALVVLVVVAADGPVELGSVARADPLGALLLVLVAGVGLVVVSFASRYLVGDPRAGRFFALTAAACAGSALLGVAATLVGLAVGWLVSGAALAALVGHERRLPAARAAVRRTLAAFAVGDLALIAAVAVVLVTVGDARLDDLGPAVRELDDRGLTALVALGLVLAALARCAQGPFGAWLPGTLAAPTPVSALLHAGIVNAGGILVVRTAAIVGGSALAMHALFVVAAITLLVGTLAMLARPDVKGVLAQSTRGQMGFMLVQCALGAFPAAMFHLLGHSMYKATLFLSSGSVVHEHAQLRRAPTPPPDVRRPRVLVAQAALALALPALVLAAAVAALAPGLADASGGLVLLAFAWVTGAQTSWWWLRARRPVGVRRPLGAVVALAVSLVVYVGLLATVKGFLEPEVADGAPAAVSGWLLLPVLAVALGVLAIRWLASVGAANRLVRGHPALARPLRSAYISALRAGRVPPVRRAVPTRGLRASS